MSVLEYDGIRRSVIDYDEMKLKPPYYMSQ